METVTIKDVEHKPSGWFEVEFEDGRVAATKDRKLSDACFQAKGTEIGVEVNERRNGKYLNIYLNKVEGVESADKPKSQSNGGEKKQSAPTKSKGADAKERRIQSQWAIGRAVELYISDHPLLAGDEDLSKIESTAKALLAIQKKLS